MVGYIYKTTNLINNKIYIGQKKAAKKANYYLGSGKYLKAAINKYGKENFICEIIEEVNTLEELDSREIYWIKFYNATNRAIGYNISNGGLVNRAFSGKNNPMYGKTHSIETRKKISQKQIEYNKTHLNNFQRPEVIKKIKNKLQNHQVAAETRNKISKTIKNSCWITDGINVINITSEYLNEFLSKGFYKIKQPKRIKNKNEHKIQVYIKYKNLKKAIDKKYLQDYINCGFIQTKRRENKEG